MKKKMKFIMMLFLLVRILCFINFVVVNLFFFKFLFLVNCLFSELVVNFGYLGSICIK